MIANTADFTGKAAYSLSSYSVVLGARQWGWGSVAGRVEPLGVFSTLVYFFGDWHHWPKRREGLRGFPTGIKEFGISRETVYAYLRTATL
jgi:hypothetical protein